MSVGVASVLVGTLAVLAPLEQTPAEAVVTDGFNPGNIIADDFFYDGTSMDAAQVQDFLNQQVSRCTIGDEGRAPGAVWGSTTIAQTCLRNYRVSTISRVANAYCRAYAGAINESAAQIVAKVSRSCGISPKVLLVMLEKEQSLVTDTWPTTRQFDIAMGYACPDSGPNNSANCDPTQTGFFQQVYRAAWQLKVYRGNPTSYNYQVGLNQIQWNPNAACGASQVYIDNAATAALYIYTPYRPNSAALSAGWGVGDACSAYGNRNFFNMYTSWFGATQTAPNVMGDLNDAKVSSGGISVRGWASDPKSANLAQLVTIYVGSNAYQLTANQSRADVAAVYPNLSASAGFSGVLSGSWAGIQEVCAFAQVKLKCRTVNFGSYAPTGDVNQVSIVGDDLLVRGWAVDLDTSSPTEVHVYVGSTGHRVTANLSRPDVARVYPSYGDGRGFLWSANAAKWAGTTQEVCVYAIGVTPDGLKDGRNVRLTCTSIDIPSSLGSQIPELGRSPIGDLNAASIVNGELVVRGWALDPDTADSIDVHVYVGGKGYRTVANVARSDVAAAYPVYGDKHGYLWSAPASQWTGVQEVCAYGINSVSGGPNPKLRCSTVDFGDSAAIPELGRSPIGDLNAASIVNGELVVRGWALDPDTADSIDVHVYVGGKGYRTVANVARSDVAAAYPVYGDKHGYLWSAPASQWTGAQEVCAYGINSVSGGPNPKLRCSTVDFG